MPPSDAQEKGSILVPIKSHTVNKWAALWEKKPTLDPYHDANEVEYMYIDINACMLLMNHVLFFILLVILKFCLVVVAHD